MQNPLDIAALCLSLYLASYFNSAATSISQLMPPDSYRTDDNVDRTMINISLPRPALSLIEFNNFLSDHTLKNIKKSSNDDNLVSIMAKSKAQGNKPWV